MNWSKNLRLSLHAVWRCPGRTLLSASGLAVGVAAVVLVFGLGGGAERAVQEALEELGENLLAVSPARAESGALRGAGRPLETLTLGDWQAIAGELAGVSRAAPIALAAAELRHGSRTLRSTVFGTTPDFQATNNQQLAAGRFLDAGDLDDRARVAVIGAHIVDRLYLAEQPLGERLLIDGAPFIVVGVLRRKGADPTGANQDDRVLVPVQAALRRLLDADHLDRIFVQARSASALDPAQAQVRELLRARHQLEHEADDFTIRTQASLLEALEHTDRTFSRLLTGLATLTLGLASAGLLAVSLLSVRERQCEIGLRKAVGARPRHVLLQFLAETLLVGALGAVAGLLAGSLAIALGAELLGWRMALTPAAVVYPSLITLAVSVISGVYPAHRAAHLDPIVALRSQ